MQCRLRPAYWLLTPSTWRYQAIVDGRLIMLRNPDVCDYVTNYFDERILPNEFVYSLVNTNRVRERSLNLSIIIDQRTRHSKSLARVISEEELSRQTLAILKRRIPITR